MTQLEVEAENVMADKKGQPQLDESKNLLAPFAGSMASAAVPPSDQERPENNGSPNAQLLAPIYELDS